MQSNVKRKGVNFHPFDALEGFKESLAKMDYDFLKEERITLSEDALEEINYKMIDALEHDKLITIKYYKDGYYKYHTGYLKKIEHMIYFKDKFRVAKDDLVEII